LEKPRCLWTGWRTGGARIHAGIKGNEPIRRDLKKNKGGGGFGSIIGL